MSSAVAPTLHYSVNSLFWFIIVYGHKNIFFLFNSGVFIVQKSFSPLLSV